MRAGWGIATLLVPLSAYATLDVITNESFYRNLSSAISAPERTALCSKPLAVADSRIKNRIELQGFEPNYFFRNANPEGTEVLASGRIGPGRRTFHFDLKTGKATELSAHYLSDAVPLVGLHGGQHIVSFPRLTDTGLNLFGPKDPEGMKYYVVESWKKNSLNGKAQFVDPTRAGVYQSFGRLSGNDHETRYLSMSDGNYSAAGPDTLLAPGLQFVEVKVSGAGAGLKMEFGAPQKFCEGHLLQLPMLSPDGKFVVALEYDEKTQTAETKVFETSDPTCSPKHHKGLGFVGAKAAVSPDGQQVALAVPRHQIRIDPRFNSLKSIRDEAPGIEPETVMDVVLVDIASGKKTLLSTDPRFTSVFPTYNQDGTINFYQKEWSSKNPKTYITRLDPKAPLTTAQNWTPAAQPCEEQRAENAQMKQVLSSLLDRMCDYRDPKEAEIRLDTMTRAQCMQFIGSFWKNRKLSAGLTSLKHKGMTQKALLELCPRS